MAKCNGSNSIERKRGDNQKITIDILNNDGERIPGMQTSDLQEIYFQALSEEGVEPRVPVITFKKTTAGEIDVYEGTDPEGNTIDIVQINPTPVKMDVPAGDYPLRMKLKLVNPPRDFHVQMSSKGIKLDTLRIKDDGVIEI